MPNKFLGDPSVLCLRNFPEAKNLWIREGLIIIFRRKNFVSKCQRNWPDKPSLLCFRNLPVTKKFMDKRGGAVSRLYVAKILYHSAV